MPINLLLDMVDSQSLLSPPLPVMTLSFMFVAGKSLFIQRLAESLEEKAMESQFITVRFLESRVNVDKVISKLCNVEGKEEVERAVLIHMDITPAVSCFGFS